MKEEFAKLYDNIKTPEEWKNDIKEKMHRAELEKTEERSASVIRPTVRKKPVRILFSAAAAICAAAAAVFIFALNTDNDSIYITDFDDSTFCKDIELTDGAVHFNRRGQEISITNGLGIGGPGHNDDDENDEALPSEVYELENGGTVTVKKSINNTVPFSDNDEWSEICGRKILITVSGGENNFIYKAFYQDASDMITVEGSNVTQREFIDFLYKKIQ